MKLTPISELTDQIVGAKGTPTRDQFEHELKMEVLSQMIKEARKSQNLTQSQLGEKLGVGKSQISKIENNAKNSRIGTIIKVLNVLKVKVKLVFEDENHTQIALG